MNLIENTFVKQTYEKIADRFSVTRGYLWKGVKEFLDKIKPFSTILEVGSGNGKNLIYRKDCFNFAFDFCEKFCEITQSRNIPSVTANNLHLPLHNNSIDYVLSVAVLHHLSTKERRIQSIKELIRVLKPNGKLFIQVWALKQPENSRRKFTQQDNYVSFKNPKKDLNKLRFYHVFQEEELKEYFDNFKNIKILDYYWEVGNWILIVKKI